MIKNYHEEIFKISTSKINMFISLAMGNKVKNVMFTINQIANQLGNYQS